MDVGSPLVADGEATELANHANGARLPTCDVPAAGCSRSRAGDAGLDAAAGQRLTTAAVVVGLIGVQLRGTLARGPQHDRIGGTASTAASSIRLSWTFAPVSFRASGMPFASVTMWRFVPSLPRSVGFGPVARPPFWRRSRRCRGSSTEVDAVSGGRAGRAARVADGPHSALCQSRRRPSRSSPNRSPSPGVATPRAAPSAARTGSPVSAARSEVRVDRPSAWALQGGSSVRSRPQASGRACLPSPPNAQTRFC